MRIALINGPNLNLLGTREPDIYGRETLQDLETNVRRHAQALGIEVECYQSNSEGQLIDALHRARLRCQGVVFNPGGYTHTSVALRDAISAIGIPVIEVHLSNLHKREEFRQTMLTTGACVGQISGLGLVGYELAISALVRLVKAGVGAGARVIAAPIVAAAEVREPREPREGRDREGRFDSDDRARRRRGRRGGRGRRRDGEPLEGDNEADDAATGSEEGADDSLSRFANMKGVNVRRGLDVLAEGDEESPPEQNLGNVSFADAEPNENPSPQAFMRPERPESKPDFVREGREGRLERGREGREPRESREPREAREPREPREVREAREPREVREEAPRPVETVREVAPAAAVTREGAVPPFRPATPVVPVTPAAEAPKPESSRPAPLYGRARRGEAKPETTVEPGLPAAAGASEVPPPDTSATEATAEPVVPVDAPVEAMPGTDESTTETAANAAAEAEGDEDATERPGKTARRGRPRKAEKAPKKTASRARKTPRSRE